MNYISEICRYTFVLSFFSGQKQISDEIFLLCNFNRIIIYKEKLTIFQTIKKGWNLYS